MRAEGRFDLFLIYIVSFESSWIESIIQKYRY